MRLAEAFGKDGEQQKKAAAVGDKGLTEALMWCNAEINPRPDVDYLFHLGSSPIELYYDSPTIVAVNDVFTLPKESVFAEWVLDKIN